MLTEFCMDVTRKQAKNECPWASYIVKVCGGYLCFESYDDYYIFNYNRNPKKQRNPRKPTKIV